jgi:hypothetical protein
MDIELNSIALRQALAVSIVVKIKGKVLDVLGEINGSLFQRKKGSMQ